jgi:hypothetical protein
MMDTLYKERLDILAGVRTSAAKQQAAVRRDDLSAIVTLPKMTATALATGATVTAAAYNSLLADFTELRQAIDQIAQKVRP